MKDDCAGIRLCIRFMAGPFKFRQNEQRNLRRDKFPRSCIMNVLVFLAFSAEGHRVNIFCSFGARVRLIVNFLVRGSNEQLVCSASWAEFPNMSLDEFSTGIFKFYFQTGYLFSYGDCVDYFQLTSEEKLTVWVKSRYSQLTQPSPFSQRLPALITQTTLLCFRRYIVLVSFHISSNPV